MENIVVTSSNGRRRTTTTTKTLFSFFIVFVYGFSLYYTSVDNSVDVDNIVSSSITPTAKDESSLFWLVAVSLGVCLAAAAAALLVVVAVRATVVTWITVLVLLTFAGKRRKSLVREGRKITTDVTMYTLMKFGIKGIRTLVAIAFVIFSFIALVRRREAAAG